MVFKGKKNVEHNKTSLDGSVSRSDANKVGSTPDPTTSLPAISQEDIESDNSSDSPMDFEDAQQQAYRNFLTVMDEAISG
jgi:hypothetical protein